MAIGNPPKKIDREQPEEVNPWREHVIENEPTHQEPREIEEPGDVPMEHDRPLEDSGGQEGEYISY